MQLNLLLGIFWTYLCRPWTMSFSFQNKLSKNRFPAKLLFIHFFDTWSLTRSKSFWQWIQIAKERISPTINLYKPAVPSIKPRAWYRQIEILNLFSFKKCLLARCPLTRSPHNCKEILKHAWLALIVHYLEEWGGLNWKDFQTKSQFFSFSGFVLLYYYNSVPLENCCVAR